MSISVHNHQPKSRIGSLRSRVHVYDSRPARLSAQDADLNALGLNREAVHFLDVVFVKGQHFDSSIMAKIIDRARAIVGDEVVIDSMTLGVAMLDFEGII